MKCPECKQEMQDSSIGEYCANKDCPVLDDANFWDGNGNRNPPADPLWLTRVKLPATGREKELEEAILDYYNAVRESNDAKLIVGKNNLDILAKLCELRRTRKNAQERLFRLIDKRL